MFVFAEVCIAEARVAEHKKVHDHAQREGVGLLRILGTLLVDFWGGIHARATDVIRAFLFTFARKPLICQSDDVEFVEQNVFRFEVVVGHSVLLEPKQPVHDLAEDYAYGDLCETVGVLELVEEFTLADVLHL